jgi:hypothetical protein
MMSCSSVAMAVPARVNVDRTVTNSSSPVRPRRIFQPASSLRRVISSPQRIGLS